jgi:hypothetical protein
MSGSKTRFGFAGGSEPPDSDEGRAARTVYGRDVHLQMPAGLEPPRFPVAHPPVPTPPPAAPPLDRPPVPEADFADENPRRRRPRQGQSRLARFLGRWTQSGRFLSRSRLDLEGDEDLQIPRSTAGRNLLLVLLVALLAFLVTFAVVKLRQRPAANRPTPVQPTAAATPSPAPTVPAAAPPAPREPPGPAVPSAPAAAPAKPIPAAAKGLGDPAAPAHRPPRAERSTAPPPAPPQHEPLPASAP